MTESQFVDQNKETWAELEELLKHGAKDPDQLNTLFRKVSGNLSYAQTYFPKRSVRVYLNDLVNRIFDKMSVKRKLNLWEAIKKYYSYTLPLEIIRNRRAFYTALLIFIGGLMIGIVTTIYYPDFTKEILGEFYVSMTDENINKKDPMAVYKDANKMGMFLGITLNNIRVAFICVILGLFTSIGTIFVLMRNAVMVGVFQTMFYLKGLFLTSFMTIWIHGTIEISSIIVAGAAGIIIGNSILFPGTYTRLQSLRIGATSAIVILFSTIPLFAVAGFLEGFVTRLTDLPSVVKLLIIGISAAIIASIYIIKPYQFYKTNKAIIDIMPTQIIHQHPTDTVTQGGWLFQAVVQYRKYFEPLLFYFMLPVSIIFTVLFYILTTRQQFDREEYQNFSEVLIMGSNINVLVISFILLMYFFGLILCLRKDITVSFSAIVRQMMQHFIGVFLCAALVTLPYFFLRSYFWVYLIFLLAMPTYFVTVLNEGFSDKYTDLEWFADKIKSLYHHYLQLFIVSLIVCFMVFCLMRSIELFTYLIKDITSWHGIFKTSRELDYFMTYTFTFILCTWLLPLLYFLYARQIQYYDKLKYSTDMSDLVEEFNPVVR
jgi:uncharacterized membrane protein SpoIIM required for sporulation